MCVRERVCVSVREKIFKCVCVCEGRQRSNQFSHKGRSWFQTGDSPHTDPHDTPFHSGVLHMATADHIPVSVCVCVCV